jgi:NAD(P)-dependent dehydrogenase (short-subunit alcohol dehydrogenase family)
VSVHQLTIGDAAQVDAVVEAAAKEHGRLHTVVVGAGTLAEQVLISEMSRKQWQTVIDQDLNGFFNVVQATLPRLREWGGGSYVHLRIGGAPAMAAARRDVGGAEGRDRGADHRALPRRKGATTSAPTPCCWA